MRAYKESIYRSLNICRPEMNVIAEWSSIIKSINAAGSYGRTRILKYAARKFREIAIQFKATQNHRFSINFLKENVICTTRMVIEKAFKSKEVESFLLQRDYGKWKEKYCKDHREFERKFRMDCFLLGKLESKKPVNYKITPYKLVRSEESELQKIVIQINKKHQERIYRKLFQIQREMKEEKNLESKEGRKVFTPEGWQEFKAI
jgi:hypothetical protein